MEATRLVLLRDGTAAGRFTLRQHETHVVVIEPNGHAFSYVGPHGCASRHLTPTLLSAQRALVRATVEFRNRFALCAGELPYAHTALWDPSTPASVVRRRRRRRDGQGNDAVTVGWPRTASYTTHTFWNDAEQSFQVESLDGAAQVRLHASGRIAHAKYLLKVQREGGASTAATGDDEFVWVEQSFPPSAAPPCFAFAVRLLQRARIARGSGVEQFQLDDGTVDERAPTAFALPRNGALDARPTFRPLSDQPDLPKNADVSVDNVARWIKGMSRSLDRLIVAEHVDGVDWVVNLGRAYGTEAATVLVMDSTGGALVECDRGFFRAFDGGGGVEQQFTVETMPMELRAFNCDFERTTAILLHAAELFEATCSSLPFESFAQAPTEAPQEPAATTLLEELTNDAGRFRAFSDGRIRVAFADRTILQVAPSEFADECSFTYRDGSTGTCTSDSASPEQLPYVRVALDFAQWAFATPEQRFRRHQLQLEQQTLVARELHKITIRQELNSVVARESGGTSAMWSSPAQDTPAELPLSRDAVAQLLRETQLHMTNVQTLLEDTHGD